MEKLLIRRPLFIQKIKRFPWVRSGKVMMSQLFSENDGKIIFNQSSSN